MPKKQTTAAKKARAAARAGEKYTTALRRQSPGGAAPSETGTAVRAGLEHRSPWDHTLEFRPFRGTGLFDRIGGQPVIGRLVDLLYDGIANDGQLRPLFPRDLADSRAMQKLFFAQWLDGPPRYSAQAYKGLGPAHAACRSRPRSPNGGWDTSARRWRPRSRRAATAS
jgi:hypothetical protein